MHKDLNYINLNLKIFPDTNFFSCAWQESYSSGYRKGYFDLQLYGLSFNSFKNNKKNSVRELQAGGIYLVLRKNHLANMRIYVGKSEKDISERIYQNFQKDKKTPINKVYLLQSEKLFNNFNYLAWFEKELIDYFWKGHLYFIRDNQNRSNYTQDHPELEKIFSNVMNVLNFFEPKMIKKTVNSPVLSPDTFSLKLPKSNDYSPLTFFPVLFILKGKIGKGGKYFAQGFWATDNQFKVLKNSWFSAKNFVKRTSGKKTFSRGIFERNQDTLKLLLVNNEIELNRENNNYILLKNHIFSTPSNAAEFFKGLSTNGPEEWKDKNGKSINHYKEKKLIKG